MITGPVSTACFNAMDYIRGRSSLGWQYYFNALFTPVWVRVMPIHLFCMQTSPPHTAQQRDTQAALDTALANEP